MVEQADRAAAIKTPSPIRLFIRTPPTCDLPARSEERVDRARRFPPLDQPWIAQAVVPGEIDRAVPVAALQRELHRHLRALGRGNRRFQSVAVKT